MLNQKLGSWLMIGVVVVILLIVGVLVIFSNQEVRLKLKSPVKALNKTRLEKRPITPTSHQVLEEKVIEVKIEADGIKPNKIVARVGQIVKFVNKDTKKHLIEAKNGIWGPVKLEPGRAVGISFKSRGRFTFNDKNYSNVPAFNGELKIIK